MSAIHLHGRTAKMVTGDGIRAAVAVADYPSRRVFTAIIESPEYLERSTDREEGLERTGLYATDPRAVPQIAPCPMTAPARR